jgi:hypothetical protein
MRAACGESEERCDRNLVSLLTGENINIHMYVHIYIYIYGPPKNRNSGGQVHARRKWGMYRSMKLRYGHKNPVNSPFNMKQ